MILTLKEIINKLELCDQKSNIYYNFCGYVPFDFFSYRGSFNYLAFGYVKNYKIYVSDFLREVKYFIKKGILVGDKGGRFNVNENLKVFVAENSNDYSGTYISEVTELNGIVILETKFEVDFNG